MKYVEYRDAMQRALRQVPEGLTWLELRERLDLPYERPCPAWTQRLEQDIGLARVQGAGRSLLWRVTVAPKRPRRTQRKRGSTTPCHSS